MRRCLALPLNQSPLNAALWQSMQQICDRGSARDPAEVDFTWDVQLA